MNALRSFLFEPSAPDASWLSCNALSVVFCIVWRILFEISYRSRLFEPHRGKLVDPKRGDWHICNVSTLHSIVIVAMAAIAVPELWQLTDREAFYGYSFWPDIATRCFQGFLFSDGAAMIKHMGLQRVTTKQMMVHHALFFAVAYFATSGPYFRFQFIWLMGCEVSTPFLNFRNQMKIANYRGDWYLYNGFAFAITFFVSRILFYGYGLVHLIQSRHIWLAKDAPVMFPVVVGLLFLGYVLMVIWFQKIIALLDRAIKAYRKRHAGGDEDGDDSGKED